MALETRSAPEPLLRSPLPSSDRFRQTIDAEDTEDDRRILGEQRDRLRATTRAKLFACANNPNTAMTAQDVESYMEGMEECNLVGPELASEAAKTKAVQELAFEFAERFIRQASEAGRIIDEAEQQRWISQNSASAWRRRMKKGTWEEKKEFVLKTLPEWQRNWAQLAADFKEVRRMEESMKLSKEDAKAYPELRILHDAAFRNGKMKYPERRNAVDKALAFLRAFSKDSEKPGERGMQGLYQKAKKDLEAAAKANVVAAAKIGAVLREIFDSGDRKRIEAFVNGKDGKGTLWGLIRRWGEMRQRFDGIEKKRASKGTPRSFHFVHLNLFLSWDEERQTAYAREANYRFEALEKERANFLLIRHALDSKDWEGAEILLKKEREKVKDMTPDDEAKLQSMEQFLRSHRPKRKEGKEKKPTDRELVEQARGLIRQVPASQQKYHAECLRFGYGAFRVLCSTWYNRVWLRRHGRGDDKREQEWLDEGKTKTEERIKYGHGRGWESNYLRGGNNQDRAIRHQKEFAAPQVQFTGHENAEIKALECWRQQNNWKYWYWVADIPMEGTEPIAYSRHEHVVTDIHPKLKSIARKLDERGILFTMDGPVEYAHARGQLASAPAKATDAEPSYASAA